VAFIAVGNLKGGVGKTTLTVNLACELASSKTRVAVIDADTQETAVEWAQAGDGLPVDVQPLPLENERDMTAWYRKARAIAQDVDHVVIDLPPHIGAATSAALMVSDLLLVPVTPSTLDVNAAVKALSLLEEARRERGDGKPGCLLVPSRVDRRTAVGKQAEAMLHELGERVGPAVGQRAAFIDAGALGDFVGRYASRSTADQEIKTLAAVVKRMVK
jgi:chromosome partitioning protein